MFNKNKKNNKGFTLVELLVVIGIIGILAVVAVPSLFKQMDKAKATQVVANINAIKTEIMTEYANSRDDGQIVTAMKTYVEGTDITSNIKLNEKYEVKDNGDATDGKINIVVTMPGKKDIAQNVSNQLGAKLTEETVGESETTNPTITYTVGK